MTKDYFWALITLIIAIILAIILISVAHEPYVGGAPATFVIPERYREQLNELDRTALDLAYIEHVKSLYKTWLVDVPTLSHDPSRITKGLNHNHQAWVMAIGRIETREQQK